MDKITLCADHMKKHEQPWEDTEFELSSKKRCLDCQNETMDELEMMGGF